MRKVFVTMGILAVVSMMTAMTMAKGACDVATVADGLSCAKCKGVALKADHADGKCCGADAKAIEVCVKEAGGKKDLGTVSYACSACGKAGDKGTDCAKCKAKFDKKVCSKSGTAPHGSK